MRFNLRWPDIIRFGRIVCGFGLLDLMPCLFSNLVYSLPPHVDEVLLNEFFGCRGILGTQLFDGIQPHVNRGDFSEGMRLSAFLKLNGFGSRDIQGEKVAKNLRISPSPSPKRCKEPLLTTYV